MGTKMINIIINIVIIIIGVIGIFELFGISELFAAILVAAAFLLSIRYSIIDYINECKQQNKLVIKGKIANELFLLCLIGILLFSSRIM